MKNKRLIANIAEVAIGLVLTVCGYTGLVDAYWSGMGTALVVVGCIMLFRQFRYQTNSEYKEKVDVEIKDERNKYLRNLAWAWTGYLFVMIAAFGSIIFKVLGMEVYSVAAGFAVCLLITIYWITFIVLRKKH